MLTWPLGVMVGRRAKYSSGGVPMVPLNRFVHDFPNLDPSHYARKIFRRYWFLTCSLGGVLFAYWSTDLRYVRDAWYTRPDLKPFKAMVA